MIEVNSLEQLSELLTKNAVVLFTQPRTCVPCRQFAPHFKTAAENSDLIFLYVDLDKVPNAVVKYGVQGVPTVKLFLDGEFRTNLKSTTAVALLNEIKSA